MDQDTLVDKSTDEVRKLVEELPKRGFPVSVALWLKANEDEKWRFYIVSPVVDEEGLRTASGRLYPLVREIQIFWIDTMKIRLIGPSNPIARDVLARFSRAPAPRISPIPWHGMWLGNMSIEAAYLFFPVGVDPGR